MDSLTQLDNFEQYWSLFQHDSNYLNDDTLLTEKEFNITSLPLSTLLEKLSTGKLTSLETTIAFIKKEIISRTSTSKCKIKNHHQEFMDAITKARYLDWYLAEYGRPIGPLHGLPISSKQLRLLNINNDDKELGNITIDSVFHKIGQLSNDGRSRENYRLNTMVHRPQVSF